MLLIQKRLDKTTADKVADKIRKNNYDILETKNIIKKHFSNEDLHTFLDDGIINMYEGIICDCESLRDSIELDISKFLKNYLGEDLYTPETVEDMDNFGWVKVGDIFEYNYESNRVKIHGQIISIKERSMRALKILAKNYRHQSSSETLPTKEDLMTASGYQTPNVREFKIKKNLFPYKELKELICYDKNRMGYFLAVNSKQVCIDKVAG